MPNLTPILVSIAALGLLAAVWGHFVESRWFQIIRHDVDHRGDRRAPGAALRIVLLSDFHYHRGARMGRRLVERINALRPDLVLLAGDLIDTNKGIEPCARELARLRAGHGVFAVLGNHDYHYYSLWDVATNNLSPPTRNDSDRLVRELERAGIEVLINESRELEIAGATVRLVGLDDAISGRLIAESAKVDPAYALIERTTLVLSHSGFPADTLPTDSRTLVMAGHTHGGQIRIPILSRLLLRGRVDSEHLHGWRELPSGGRVYVNRGLGTTHLFPFRFNARPEVAVFELVADARQAAIPSSSLPLEVGAVAEREEC